MDVRQGILANETKSLNNYRSETDLEVFSRNSGMGLIDSSELEELLKLILTGDSWMTCKKKYKAYLDGEQLNYLQEVSSFDIWAYK